MEKITLGFLISITLIVAVLLIFFYVLQTTFVFKFILVSAFLGPGMGISYGLGNPSFRPTAHLFTLLIVNTLAVALIYAALRKLPFQKRFENKILDRVMKHVQDSQKNMEATMNKVSKTLESRFGNNGFYMALGLLTFAYGAYVTGSIAFFIRVKLRPAMISIAIGSAVSIVFWWYLAIGVIPFITPTMIFVVVTGVSIVLIVYGLVRENRIVKKIRVELSEHGKNLQKKINKSKW